MEIEKSCFVEFGEGLKLPIGFRFKPTEQELVVDYLKRKIDSVPLPASIIPEHRVFDTNPWDLPGEMNERMYFFSKRKVNMKNCRSSIVEAGCGYWKHIGQDKVVVSISKKNNHQILGMKRTSVFCQRKRKQTMKNCWVMHQYFLLESIANLPSTTQTGDWVACCIYRPKLRWERKKQQASVFNFKTSMNI